MSQDQVYTITKSISKKLNLRDFQSPSLFSTLSNRIEQHSVNFKSSSSSTRSAYDSEEEKEILMFRTPQKMCCTQTDWKHLEPPTRESSAVLEIPLKEEMELIDEIKTQGKLDALELNLKFKSIAENSEIQQVETLCVSDFVSEFDRCFEMVQLLQNTHSAMKAAIAELEQQYDDSQSVYEEQSKEILFEAYSREVIENSPVARSLCEIIGTLMNTSLFEHESQQVIEGLMELARLTAKKQKKTDKNSVRSAVMDYKDLLKKINNLDISDRICIDVSHGFLESLKKNKPKKQK